MPFPFKRSSRSSSNNNSGENNADPNSKHPFQPAHKSRPTTGTNVNMVDAKSYLAAVRDAASRQQHQSSNPLHDPDSPSRSSSSSSITLSKLGLSPSPPPYSLHPSSPSTDPLINLQPQVTRVSQIYQVAKTSQRTRSFDPDPEWIPRPEDPHCLRHAEFGWEGEEGDKWRYISQFVPPPPPGPRDPVGLAGVPKTSLNHISNDLNKPLLTNDPSKAPNLPSYLGDNGEEDPTYEKRLMAAEASLKTVCEEPSYWIYLATYVSYLMLIVLGHVRDFFEKRLYPETFAALVDKDGYAALNSDFDSFYTRRLKVRIDDCFARPVSAVAGRTITCLDRATDDHCLSFRFTGTTTQALNISSYNYLGFAQSRGGCAESVEEMTRLYGIGTGGSRNDVGTVDLHVKAEKLVARFVGVEDAMVIPMGFATNSTTLPTLASKGSLIISDELNHSSIRFGARLSGAMVRQYKHNDMDDLENLLREVISQGQPRTHRPWRKILILVEGLYSMEGTLVNLPRLLDLKRKYKFYLYVDEAHSIGALGPRGRGICDYFGIDPQEIDILMGTLTKSFGAAGGYIAGNRELIQALRHSNHANNCGESMAAPVVTQIIAALAGIMGPESLEVVPGLEKMLPTRLLDGVEGTARLRRLAFNARYLHLALRKLGFIVYGHPASPIVPLLIFNPGKMPLFSRLMLERYNIVVVVVAYPATPLVSSRVRFCVSAAHTKDDLDRLLRACDEIGDVLGLKIGSGGKRRWGVEEVISRAEELVLGGVDV